MRKSAYFALAIFLIVLAAIAYQNTTQGDTMTEHTVVLLDTTKGPIEIELDRENAPITTENFLQYVKDGHFDGTIFHRVIDGFMIQGGGFTPDGKQKQVRAPIPIESKNGLKNNRGTVAMARTSDPNSATAQFFINLVNNDFLNYQSEASPGYAVFGTVTGGMETVDEIAVVRKSNRPMPDWPTEDIVILKATIK